MKMRLLPVALSVIISSVVLFGGWFAYNSLAMENPLSDIVHQAPGVKDASIVLASDHVNIDLTLQPDADLREIVQTVSTNGASIIGKRTLKFELNNNSNPELDAWWSKALFDVAQAMETKQYTLIPTALEKQATTLDGLQVNTQMDINNVYVRLTKGEQSKFIILPRVPGRIGVWPNE